MKTPRLIKTVLPAALFLCQFLSPARAVELSIIKGNFDSTGVDTDARGQAASIFNKGIQRFDVDAWGLTPGATYTLTLDGVAEATFTASTKGSVHADFRNHTRGRGGDDGGDDQGDDNLVPATVPHGTKLPLTFDPRGHQLALSDGTNDVLTMVYSGEGEPDDIRVDERTSLAPVDTTTSTHGRVELRYLEQKNQDRFIVHFNAMDRGNYQLFIDGELQAEVDLTRGRSDQRTFELLKNPRLIARSKGHGNSHGNSHGQSKKLDLDFDPRGLVVDVVKDGVITFSGVMKAQIPGLGDVFAGASTTTLTNTGADADAAGTADVNLAPDGTETLTVAVSALPAGDYEVWVGGMLRGTVTVTGTEPASSGQIVFSTNPSASESLLNFDVLGAAVEIRQGATVFLTGTIGSELTPVEVTTTSTTLPLLNQGVTADASGHATLTEDGTTLTSFDVEVTGLAAGNYDLKVGGTVVGTLVVAEVSGVLSGGLVFDNSVGGLPLSFDPRGQVVTVEQAGTIYLSRSL